MARRHGGGRPCPCPGPGPGPNVRLWRLLCHVIIAARAQIQPQPYQCASVRGTMYYWKALMLQSYLERVQSEGLAVSADTHFELYPEARAEADLKFTYVVTCQIYGMQKAEGKPEASDIALLLQRNKALRVVSIDVVQSVKNLPRSEFFTQSLSKLTFMERISVKNLPRSEFFTQSLSKLTFMERISEIHSVELPGNLKLGEGKPENQNHAIIFTSGNAVQTIDMNQTFKCLEHALDDSGLLAGQEAYPVSFDISQVNHNGELHFQ
ncbi:hypothetical protein ACP4OV_027115 [Aristida adscensionis]